MALVPVIFDVFSNNYLNIFVMQIIVINLAEG
jgi:hypothetical protein